MLTEALPWVKGAPHSAPALCGCCQVLLLQLLVQSCEGSSPWAVWDALSVLPQLPPTPDGPMARGVTKMPPSSLRAPHWAGGHSTEPARHGQRRGLYCPQPQVYQSPGGGSVTCGLISVVQRDLCVSAAPSLSGSLLYTLQQPPSHQHLLLLLSRSLIQLFPQYGLWSQTIPTWQLSWRGWWKSGKETRW